MAYRSSSANTGVTVNPSVSVPAGVAADDIVILVVSVDNVAEVFASGDYPAGFSELAEVDVTTDGQTVAVAWKRATGADSGSYTFANHATALEWACEAFVFSGRDTANPPTLTSASSNAANASPVSVNAATITALTGDDLLWISAPDVNATGIGSGHTPPSGYTERQDVELGFTNLSGATKDNATAGATGTVTGTLTLTSGGAGWAAFLVRIPVAAAAADPSDGARLLLETGDGLLLETGVSGIRREETVFNDIRQNLINGLDASGVEATGFDTVVRPAIPLSAVVRTSDTVVTITLPAVPSYNITTNETITATVPSVALTGGVGPYVASPTIVVSSGTLFTTTLSASQASAAARVWSAAAIRAVGQAQAAARVRSAAGIRSAAQTQTAARVRVAWIARAAVQATSGVALAARAVLRSLTATQAQGAARIASTGGIRATVQTQAAAAVRSVLAVRVGSQTQTSTRVRAVAAARAAVEATSAIVQAVRVTLRTFAAVQASSAARVVAAAVARMSGQSQAGTVQRSTGASRSAAQPQAATRVRFVSSIRSASQASAAVVALIRVTLRTFTAAQAQTAVRAATMGVARAAVQGTAATVRRAAAVTKAGTQAASAVRTVLVGARRTASHGTAAAVSVAAGLRFVFLTAVQAQTATVRRAVTATRAIAQGQAAAAVRAIFVTRTAVQSTIAAASRASVKSVTASAAQGAAASRAFAVKVIRTATVGNLATARRAGFLAFQATQGTAAARRSVFSRVLAAVQATIAVFLAPLYGPRIQRFESRVASHEFETAATDVPVFGSVAADVLVFASSVVDRRFTSTKRATQTIASIAA